MQDYFGDLCHTVCNYCFGGQGKTPDGEVGE